MAGIPFMKIVFASIGVVAFATVAQAQFLVRTVDAPGNGAVLNIDQAETLLASQPSAGSGNFGVINFVGGGSDADFPGGASFPGGLGGTDDFAMEALARIIFNTPGTYVFQVNSDDGFRLRRDVNPDGSGGTVSAEFIGPRGPLDTDSSAFIIPPATGGFVNFRLTYFEHIGGEEIEFSYSLNGGPQQLVGSTGDLTVQPIPEPASFALLGIGLAAFAGRRKRLVAA